MQIGVEEGDAHLEGVDGNADLRCGFYFVPSALHVGGAVYVVEHKNGVGVRVRQALVEVAHGGIVGVVGIEKRNVDCGHIFQRSGQRVVDIAFDWVYVVGVFALEKSLCEGVERRFAFERYHFGARVGFRQMERGQSQICAEFENVSCLAVVGDAKEQFGVFAACAGVSCDGFDAGLARLASAESLQCYGRAVVLQLAPQSPQMRKGVKRRFFVQHAIEPAKRVGRMYAVAAAMVRMSEMFGTRFYLVECVYHGHRCESAKL